MEQAQTRLRKTFKYPTDDDHTALDDLDEQQQEDLITSLRATSSKSDFQYKLIFTLLPVVAILPFLFTLTAARFVSSLLCIANLVCSAYTMYLVPPETTVRKAAQSWWMPFQWPEKREVWYVSQILQWINLGMSAVCLLGSWVQWKVYGDEDGGVYAVLMLLPMVVLCVVGTVRQGMEDVRRGVGELEGLKYDLKGA